LASHMIETVLDSPASTAIREVGSSTRRPLAAPAR